MNRFLRHPPLGNDPVANHPLGTPLDQPRRNLIRPNPIRPVSTRLKSRLTVTLSLTLALLATGSFGLTHSAEARPGKGGRHAMFEEKMKELNLTDEQKKKVQEIRKQGREQAKSLRKDLKAARTQLREALARDTSKDELTKLFQSVQEKQQATAAHMFNQAMTIREILTPEQRKKAGEMMSRFFDRSKKRGGPDLDDGDEE